MNMRADINGIGRFFYRSESRIICILCAFWGWLAGQVRGGVEYWRGKVCGGDGVGEQGGAGVNVEQGGGCNGRGFGKPATANGLAEGLPAEVEPSGDDRIDIVFFSKLGNQAGHDSLPVGAARGRLNITSRAAWVQRRLQLCQRVIDKTDDGRLSLVVPRVGA